MYRHIHQGISIAYRIRWMSNKQHTVRNGDTDRYPCCFMIGCWAEKPKHQHKSWIAYSLSHGSEPRTQNSESYSSSTQYARNIDIIVYTAFYTWNVRILCAASGGIYSAPNGSNNTRRSQILFVVCATFVWCFFYTRSLPLSLGIFLSMCACALNRPSFHVFFFNGSMYSSPCVLIYSACVRQTTFNVYRIHFKFYRFDVASYWVGSLLLCCSMLCPIQCIKMVAHRQSTKTFSWNIHKIKSFLVIWCCSHDCHSCIQFFGYLPSHSKFHRRK